MNMPSKNSNYATKTEASLENEKIQENNLSKTEASFKETEKVQKNDLSEEQQPYNRRYYRRHSSFVRIIHESTKELWTKIIFCACLVAVASSVYAYLESAKIKRKITDTNEKILLLSLEVNGFACETNRNKRDVNEVFQPLTATNNTIQEANDEEDHLHILLKFSDLKAKVSEYEQLIQNHVTKVNQLNSSLMNSKEHYESEHQTIQQSVSNLHSKIKIIRDINEEQDNNIRKLNETIKEIKDVDSIIEVRKDCSDVAEQGHKHSGVYWINVNNKSVQVYCDLNTDGGNWTVMQRRINGDVHFYRDWKSYRNGFGNLQGNFWMGLETIHAITTSGSYQIHIGLEDFSSTITHASYGTFSVGDESTNYRLTIGGYSGSIGNAMEIHNNQPFSTKDRDNDPRPDTHCSTKHKGAFWYGEACYRANLNGLYINREEINHEGIVWYHWKDDFITLKRVVMKFKSN